MRISAGDILHNEDEQKMSIYLDREPQHINVDLNDKTSYYKLLDNLFLEKITGVRSRRVRVINDHKYYFGVSQDKAICNINVNSFRGHYFIEVRTEFTYSYFKHKYLYREDIPEMFKNRIYDEKAGKWYATQDQSHFITLGQLVQYLLYISEIFNLIKCWQLRDILQNKVTAILCNGNFYSITHEELECAQTQTERLYLNKELNTKCQNSQPKTKQASLELGKEFSSKKALYKHYGFKSMKHLPQCYEISQRWSNKDGNKTRKYSLVKTSE